MTEEELKKQTLLTKEQRDEVYDSGTFQTCGEERIAYCKAQQNADYPVFVQEGRRQVVEWMKPLTHAPESTPSENCPECIRQAQLKEWGIK